MTLKDLATNDSAKAELSRLLNTPVMAHALDMLRDANLPKVILKLPDAPEHMDPMHALALSAAQRAGFQSAITLLRNLPRITNPESVTGPGQAWEWLAPAEPVSQPKASRRRKTV